MKFKRALQEDAPLELHMWGTNLYTGELLTDLHRPCKQLVTSQWGLLPNLQDHGHVCKLGLTKIQCSSGSVHWSSELHTVCPQGRLRHIA